MNLLKVIKNSRASRWRRPQDAPRVGNNPLIFSSPELQNLGVRAFWHLSTAAMWSLVLYLLMPLSTLSAWVISAILGYTQLLADDVYLETVSQLKIYLFIISTIGASIAAKLIFNVSTQNINFRKSTHELETITQKDMDNEHESTKVGATSKFIIESNYKRMVAHHDEHGHLIGVDLLPAPLVEPE